ncbi:hypothetical protein PUNSTDRAFT_121062 [Punctularia strigosozonata HHB-11173 SS5]|uniref:uncharacterized protein n=1 Tax=Punctularia strigosozonata (strain HHB-11173) TaxID=741275 RepID=UPI0004417D2E|nr:uncharacterized protein PUNSTDRAFT_121062 [Punctularia strigosozonata HHB-11173 SS5]EIN07858.1 hypothetical protein PUNSTDRAFT_121062 [Punctularia strigosozonata HHB-11173 SS5]
MRPKLPSLPLPLRPRLRRRQRPAPSDSLCSRLPPEVVVVILSQVYDLTRWQPSDAAPTSRYFNHWLADSPAHATPAALSQTDFLALLRVCRGWYLAGVAALYAEPFLPSPRALKLFARTVTARADLAALVRTLVLVEPPFRFSWVRVLLLSRGRRERTHRRQAERAEGRFYAVVAACAKVDAVCLRSRRNTHSLLPLIDASATGIARLRRLTLCGWQWRSLSDTLALGAAVAGGAGGAGDHPAAAAAASDAALRGLEELSLSDFYLPHYFRFPTLPALRTLRVSGTITDIFEPVFVVPPFEALRTLEKIELQGNCWYDYALTQCIQSYAGTLKELSLIGSDELCIARTLDLQAFEALRRLVIGPLEPDQSPFEVVRVPASLRVLVAHSMVGCARGTARKVEYFFRSAGEMGRYLGNGAELAAGRRKGARLAAKVVGGAPPDLACLCREWSIPLEEMDPDDVELVDDEKPLTSSLTISFLPSKWEDVYVL